MVVRKCFLSLSVSSEIKADQRGTGMVLSRCRSCTSTSAWLTLMKQGETKKAHASSTTTSAGTAIATAETTASTSTSSSTSSLLPSNCPADVETLGRSTWTFLHTLSASYPRAATSPQQSEMKQFLSLFAQLYPCWHCAEDFQRWMGTPSNAPQLRGRRDFMRWMCEAHNEVNEKLGKPGFDCGEKSLEARWGNGPDDGRCG